MKIFFDMVGCRLNQAEIDMLAIDLARKGATIVSKAEQADTIIINTCCVTLKASADSRKMIRHYKENTNARVVSTGCWVNVDFADAGQMSDLAVLNVDKEDIPLLLSDKVRRLQTQLNTKPALGKRTRTRGFVKVQDGCNNACSFCLTTIARGRSVSKAVDEVVERINQLETMGVKEIVLTGVQLGSWGKDLQPRQTIDNLLGEIISKTDIPRIRLSSIEPWDVNIALVKLLNHARVCAHLHVPLQSGADEILRAMKRPMSTERYMEMIEQIRNIAPQTNITTDVIAGFPGETEELFNESYEFIQNCDFDGGHVFSFSPMPGTEAALMESGIHTNEIKRRTKKLIQQFKQKQEQSRQSLIGSKQMVLYESHKNTEHGVVWSGFSESYLRVNTISEESLSNRIMETEISGLDLKGNLIGEIPGLQALSA